ncbi:MAG TPA: hypothetical protein VL633_00505 [Bacteroidota bacterium]|nr:hypothetical protein [Bacteroidota bacterium]
MLIRASPHSTNVLPFALFLYSAKPQEAQSPQCAMNIARDICEEPGYF